MNLKSIFAIALFLFSGNTLAADFNHAIVPVLNHEGFITYGNSEPGGISNYGISIDYLRKLVKQAPEVQALVMIDGLPTVSIRDVEQMKIEDAIHIYRIYWWDAFEYGNIKNQSLANKILDMSVNMGSTEAHTLVARAYQKLKNKPMTNFLSINRLSAKDSQKLLDILREEQAYFYRTLVAKNPSSKKFLKGWLKRAAD